MSPNSCDDSTSRSPESPSKSYSSMTIPRTVRPKPCENFPKGTDGSGHCSAWGAADLHRPASKVRSRQAQSTWQLWTLIYNTMNRYFP